MQSILYKINCFTRQTSGKLTLCDMPKRGLAEFIGDFLGFSLSGTELVVFQKSFIKKQQFDFLDFK